MSSDLYERRELPGGEGPLNLRDARGQVLTLSQRERVVYPSSQEEEQYLQSRLIHTINAAIFGLAYRSGLPISVDEMRFGEQVELDLLVRVLTHFLPLAEKRNLAREGRQVQLIGTPASTKSSLAVLLRERKGMLVTEEDRTHHLTVFNRVHLVRRHAFPNDAGLDGTVLRLEDVLQMEMAKWFIDQNFLHYSQEHSNVQGGFGTVNVGGVIQALVSYSVIAGMNELPVELIKLARLFKGQNETIISMILSRDNAVLLAGDDYARREFFLRPDNYARMLEIYSQLEHLGIVDVCFEFQGELEAKDLKLRRRQLYRWQAGIIEALEIPQAADGSDLRLFDIVRELDMVGLPHSARERYPTRADYLQELKLDYQHFLLSDVQAGLYVTYLPRDVLLQVLRTDEATIHFFRAMLHWYHLWEIGEDNRRSEIVEFEGFDPRQRVESQVDDVFFERRLRQIERSIQVDALLSSLFPISRLGAHYYHYHVWERMLNIRDLLLQVGN